MATNTQTITGIITKPGGGPVTSGFVRFHLSSYDTDPVADEVVTDANIDAVIASDGSISVELWPNERGPKGTFYKVYVCRQTERGEVRELAGNIQIGEAGPYELADLLSEQIPPAEGVYYRIISQAEYDAAIQAAADAEAAATEAESSATNAAASAAEAALYDGLSFDTIAIMAAYEGFVNGGYYTVNSAFNNEPETFRYDSSSTLTADGVLIVTPASGVGRYVSTRTVFVSISELETDVRQLSEGVYIRLVEGDAILERAPDAALDADLDYSGTGGVKWYYAGPNFPSRAIAAKTLQRMNAAGRAFTDGIVITDGLVEYVWSGGTTISDMPGVSPFGDLTPLHFPNGIVDAFEHVTTEGQMPIKNTSSTYRAASDAEVYANIDLQGGDIDGGSEYIFLAVENIDGAKVSDFKAGNLTGTGQIAAVRLGDDVPITDPDISTKIRRDLVVEDFKVNGVESTDNRAWGVSLFGELARVSDGNLRNVGKSGAAWRQSEGVYLKTNGGIVDKIMFEDCAGHHVAEAQPGDQASAQGALTVKGIESGGKDYLISNIYGRWTSDFNSPASPSLIHVVAPNTYINGALAENSFGPIISTGADDFNNFKARGVLSVEPTGIHGVRLRHTGRNTDIEFKVDDLKTRGGSGGVIAGLRWDNVSGDVRNVRLSPDIFIDSNAQLSTASTIAGFHLVANAGGKFHDVIIENGRIRIPSGGGQNLYGVLTQGAGSIGKMVVRNMDFTEFEGSYQTMFNLTANAPSDFQFYNNDLPVFQSNGASGTETSVFRVYLEDGQSATIRTCVLGKYISGGTGAAGDFLSEEIVLTAHRQGGGAILDATDTVLSQGVNSAAWGVIGAASANFIEVRVHADGNTANWNVDVDARVWSAA